MRLRPIGPGIGGLYYSFLLKNARSLEPAQSAAKQLPLPGLPAARGGHLRRLAQSLAGWARKCGQRLIEARMAQAEAQIARSRALFDADTQLARSRAIGVRYY